MRDLSVRTGWLRMRESGGCLSPRSQIATLFLSKSHRFKTNAGSIIDAKCKLGSSFPPGTTKSQNFSQNHRNL